MTQSFTLDSRRDTIVDLRCDYILPHSTVGDLPRSLTYQWKRKRKRFSVFFASRALRIRRINLVVSCSIHVPVTISQDRDGEGMTREVCQDRMKNKKTDSQLKGNLRR